MLRITDQVVADWVLFSWEQEGEIYEQVRAYLMNGMILILDLDDFLSISYDD